MVSRLGNRGYFAQMQLPCSQPQCGSVRARSRGSSLCSQPPSRGRLPPAKTKAGALLSGPGVEAPVCALSPRLGGVSHPPRRRQEPYSRRMCGSTQATCALSPRLGGISHPPRRRQEPYSRRMRGSTQATCALSPRLGGISHPPRRRQEPYSRRMRGSTQASNRSAKKLPRMIARHNMVKKVTAR
jgi:hypothetical protein